VLVRRYGTFDAAEDAVQEALVTASRRWPRDGVPDEPFGWLVRSASRRMIDAWRSERARTEREQFVGRERAPAVGPSGEEDDTLLLLFMCCHPALTPASAIPLTLRAVGGLTTAEIARAFLVPEPTMAQRISRAKARIRASGARFAMPGPDELATRQASVLHVLYLMFNEGYASSGGSELIRADLTDEAIRLNRMLQAGLPSDGEVNGLLALMLLTDARRPARTDTAGDIVPLPEQDRSRWEQAKISEGLECLERAIAAGPLGEYAIQAAIAAVHDQAPTADQTDWGRIAELYRSLELLTGNPIVTLNRAVAVAMVRSPEAGLAVVDEVAERLAASHRVDAVRGHLLEMSGHLEDAAMAYASAASHATSLPDRRYLLKRAARARR
jgi:predicted RNA polymerase sigma factor